MELKSVTVQLKLGGRDETHELTWDPKAKAYVSASGTVKVPDPKAKKVQVFVRKDVTKDRWDKFTGTCNAGTGSEETCQITNKNRQQQIKQITVRFAPTAKASEASRSWFADYHYTDAEVKEKIAEWVADKLDQGELKAPADAHIKALEKQLKGLKLTKDELWIKLESYTQMQRPTVALQKPLVTLKPRPPVEIAITPPKPAKPAKPSAIAKEIAAAKVAQDKLDQAIIRVGESTVETVIADWRGIFLELDRGGEAVWKSLQQLQKSKDPAATKATKDLEAARGRYQKALTRLFAILHQKVDRKVHDLEQNYQKIQSIAQKGSSAAAEFQATKTQFNRDRDLVQKAIQLAMKAVLLPNEKTSPESRYLLGRLKDVDTLQQKVKQIALAPAATPAPTPAPAPTGPAPIIAEGPAPKATNVQRALDSLKQKLAFLPAPAADGSGYGKDLMDGLYTRGRLKSVYRLAASLAQITEGFDRNQASIQDLELIKHKVAAIQSYLINWKIDDAASKLYNYRAIREPLATKEDYGWLDNPGARKAATTLANAVIKELESLMGPGHGVRSRDLPWQDSTLFGIVEKKEKLKSLQESWDQAHAILTAAKTYARTRKTPFGQEPAAAPRVVAETAPSLQGYSPAAQKAIRHADHLYKQLFDPNSNFPITGDRPKKSIYIGEEASIPRAIAKTKAQLQAILDDKNYTDPEGLIMTAKFKLDKAEKRFEEVKDRTVSRPLLMPEEKAATREALQAYSRARGDVSTGIVEGKSLYAKFFDAKDEPRIRSLSGTDIARYRAQLDKLMTKLGTALEDRHYARLDIDQQDIWVDLQPPREKVQGMISHVALRINSIEKLAQDAAAARRTARAEPAPAVEPPPPATPTAAEVAAQQRAEAKQESLARMALVNTRRMELRMMRDKVQKNRTNPETLSELEGQIQDAITALMTLSSHIDVETQAQSVIAGLNAELKTIARFRDGIETSKSHEDVRATVAGFLEDAQSRVNAKGLSEMEGNLDLLNTIKSNFEDTLENTLPKLKGDTSRLRNDVNEAIIKVNGYIADVQEAIRIEKLKQGPPPDREVARPEPKPVAEPKEKPVVKAKPEPVPLPSEPTRAAAPEEVAPKREPTPPSPPVTGAKTKMAAILERTGNLRIKVDQFSSEVMSNPDLASERGFRDFLKDLETIDKDLSTLMDLRSDATVSNDSVTLKSSLESLRNSVIDTAAFALKLTCNGAAIGAMTLEPRLAKLQEFVKKLDELQGKTSDATALRTIAETRAVVQEKIVSLEAKKGGEPIGNIAGRIANIRNLGGHVTVTPDGKGIMIAGVAKDRFRDKAIMNDIFRMIRPADRDVTERAVLLASIQLNLNDMISEGVPLQAALKNQKITDVAPVEDPRINPGMITVTLYFDSPAGLANRKAATAEVDAFKSKTRTDAAAAEAQRIAPFRSLQSILSSGAKSIEVREPGKPELYVSHVRVKDSAAALQLIQKIATTLKLDENDDFFIFANPVIADGLVNGSPGMNIRGSRVYDIFPSPSGDLYIVTRSANAGFAIRNQFGEKEFLLKPYLEKVGAKSGVTITKTVSKVSQQRAQARAGADAKAAQGLGTRVESERNIPTTPVAPPPAPAPAAAPTPPPEAPAAASAETPPSEKYGKFMLPPVFKMPQLELPESKEKFGLDGNKTAIYHGFLSPAELNKPSIIQKRVANIFGYAKDLGMQRILFVYHVQTDESRANYDLFSKTVAEVAKTAGIEYEVAYERFATVTANVNDEVYCILIQGTGVSNTDAKIQYRTFLKTSQGGAP